MGNNDDPITLHKYLYANVDPANMIDPTGNFSIGSIGAGLSIGATLSGVAQASFDVTSLLLQSGGDVTPTDLGKAVLTGLLGKKLLKPLAKVCKSKKKKSNRCTYAIGWTNAQAQISLLLATTLTSTAIKNHSVVVGGVFDIGSGKAAASFNKGSRQRPRTHPKLIRHLNSTGRPDVGCAVSNSGRLIMGNCAEFLAANKLLKKGGKLKNFVWTQAYNVDTSGAGPTGRGSVKPYCSNCKMTFALKNRKK